MKVAKVILFSSIILLFACTGTSKKIDLALEETTAQPFTDTVKLDTFKIAMTGSSSKNANLELTIKSHDGKLIYKESLSGADLLKSYLANTDEKTEDEKIKFLKDEVKYFFDEEHFLVPAVTDEEKPDQNAPDKSFYQELKKTQLSGFNYRLGKEVKLYIAWSVKERKVKVYYRCC